MDFETHPIGTRKLLESMGFRLTEEGWRPQTFAVAQGGPQSPTDWIHIWPPAAARSPEE